MDCLSCGSNNTHQTTMRGEPFGVLSDWWECDDCRLGFWVKVQQTGTEENGSGANNDQ